MVHNAQDLCSLLNLKYSDELIPHYEEGINLYNEKGLFVVNKERILSYHNEYNIFRKWLDDVLLACDEVAKDEDLLIYIYTLISIIKANKSPHLIGTPNRDRMDTDFAPLFALLYFLDDMIGEMKKRGCSYDIISDTLYGFDSEINDYYAIYSRSGMRIYIGWFMLFVKSEILRIGRFQFQLTKLNDKIRVYTKDGDVKILMDGVEMHKDGMLFGSEGQTDEESKYFADITVDGDTVTGYACNELGECVPEKVTLIGYKEVLKTGDNVISVHIPSDGNLDHNISEKSYADAVNIFKNHYADYNFKAFYCASWLLEKKLKELLGKETNITRFADKYNCYPLLSGSDDVYRFLFSQKGRVEPSELPENSSMHKAVKNFLMEGNVFYTKAGIRLFD